VIKAEPHVGGSDTAALIAARDTRLDRSVRIKILHETLAAGQRTEP
jgi:hypothetical protein